jgi:Fe2+ transport system protein FeoA
VAHLTHQLIPLNQMPSGTKGIVAAVLGRSDDVHRLHEMGFRDGTPIEMLEAGSPCLLKLQGQKLCFRADDLLRVLVKPGDSP